MIDNSAYALATNGKPKIIIWDETWPQLDAAIIIPVFRYAFGVPPKKIVPEKNICPMLVRPEFRLSYNNEIIYSSICEFHFMLHLLKPGVKPHKTFFLEAIKTFVHPFYKEEFLVRTGRKFSLFYTLRDNEEEILRSGERVLKENGWL